MTARALSACLSAISAQLSLRSGGAATTRAAPFVPLPTPARTRQAPLGAESLLRRLRTRGSLPRLHPLVDLCNAISVAFAIPVAVFDVSKVAGDLEVRYAAGNEEYLTFAGEVERPAAHEVIFADRAGRAHARRWTNRQSGLSAVQSSTSAALIVAEAMHGTASSDMRRLTEAIADELAATWPTKPTVAILSQRSSSFTFGPKRAGPWLTRAGAGDEHP